MVMIVDHLKHMLVELMNKIHAEKWFGKERECVNRFVFSKLVKAVGCCPEFMHTEQIAFEGRMKQVSSSSKKEVCKDLVIWKYKNQTCFATENLPPQGIIGWKHRKKQPFPYDIEWLKHYTQFYPSCFGIALNIENESEYRATGGVITQGNVQDEHWLDYSPAIANTEGVQ